MYQSRELTAPCSARVTLLMPRGSSPLAGQSLVGLRGSRANTPQRHWTGRAGRRGAAHLRLTGISVGLSPCAVSTVSAVTAATSKRKPQFSGCAR